MTAHLVFIDNNSSLAQLSLFMYYFPELIEIIGDKSRTENIVLSLDVALKLSDEMLMNEVDLVLLFDNLRCSLILMGYLMGGSHSTKF